MVGAPVPSAGTDQTESEPSDSSSLPYMIVWSSIQAP